MNGKYEARSDFCYHILPNFGLHKSKQLYDYFTGVSNLILNCHQPCYILGQNSYSTVPQSLITEGFTTISPIQEKNQGSKQSILEILGARLVTNELLDNEPEEEGQSFV